MIKLIIRKAFRILPKLRTLFYKYWNRFYFWSCGVKYGKRMRAFNKIYVLGSGKVSIGDDFDFSSGDSINPICRNIRGTIYTATPDSEIIIGNRVGMSSACLWAKEQIIIGNDVKIGGNCLIMDNDAHPHNFNQRRNSYKEDVDKKEFFNIIQSAPVVIEDDVWIGAHCIILKSVHIGARSIIAAGSVVVKDIPSDCIAGGNPCKLIRHL